MKNKTNVLIILSDQQRYDTIHYGGFEHMITPGLDDLAQDGEYCTHAYSGNPVCMPARHDLITGFPARVHGYYGNAENESIRDYSVPTIGRIFSKAGYRTAAIGKMHFSPPREHHGFGEMRLMEELPKQRQNDQYLMFLEKNGLGKIQNPHGVRPHIYHIPQEAQQPYDFHGSKWVADETIRWLEENEKQPFMAMCGFIQPHPPWNIPAEWDELYKNIRIPEAIMKSRLPFEDESKSEWFGDNDTEEQKEKIRKAYYTSVSMVDKSVGDIISYLKNKGIYDNTLIIYTSDHGEMLQDKGYYSKELPYDSAVRVPLIIKYPKCYEKQGIRNDFVDLLDILPTCLDICGLRYENGNTQLFGKSLLSGEEKKYQFAATGTMPLRWVMSCDKEYKYIYHYMGGYEELFKMDSPEIKNLLDGDLTEEQTIHYRELKNQAIQYEEKWGIEGGVEDGMFVQMKPEIIHPSVRGKYHFWSNAQMQKFYENDKYDRGRALEEEMGKALSNKDKSGVALKNVFNAPEWKEQFSECFQQYTKTNKIPTFPFE